MNPLWGIDLGGTKIEGVVIESKDSQNVLARLRLPTEQEGGYQHIIEQIGNLIGQLKKETGLTPERIGMGTPGTLDPSSRRMKNCNTTSLNGMPLRDDLEKKLGIPFTLANDANCFAVAEARFGAVPEAVPNARVVFGVIMGTGVGGGVVLEGKAINGKQGLAGEWGHNFLDESGGPCYCGKIGCVEKVISGPSLERYYQSLTGNKLKLRDIAARSNEEEEARQTMQRLTHYFGKAISVVINILDPDAIVLGGGVGNINELLTEGVEAAKQFVFNTGVDHLDTVFLKPKLGDSAGVFGAALLVA
ncbi:MAG: ROK family protein [Saprospiraceae bacterium]|nr:ROK family protein [Saprospiraceae bacterium]